jgi:hypothetical protein
VASDLVDAEVDGIPRESDFPVGFLREEGDLRDNPEVYEPVQLLSQERFLFSALSWLEDRGALRPLLFRFQRKPERFYPHGFVRR